MYKRPVTYLNTNGLLLCPEILLKAVVLSGLTWGMPPAQVYTTMTWPLINPTVVHTEIKEDTAIVRYDHPVTMLGLPVEIDKELPTGTVQLRYQGAVLFEIQNLATASGFEEFTA